MFQDVLQPTKEANGHRKEKEKDEDDWKDNDLEQDEDAKSEKTALLHGIAHEPRSVGSPKSHRVFRSARKGSRGSEYELRRVTWADDDHGDELEEEFIIPSRPFISRRASGMTDGSQPLCIFGFLLALIFLLWITLPKRHRL